MYVAIVVCDMTSESIEPLVNAGGFFIAPNPLPGTIRAEAQRNTLILPTYHGLF